MTSIKESEGHQPKQLRFRNSWKRSLISLIDSIGSVLFHCKAPRVAERPSPKKILLIRLDHLGDCLFTLPAVDALHQNYPNSELHFLGGEEARAVMQGDSRINQFLDFPNSWFSRKKKGGLRSFVSQLKRLKSEKYDWAIDFRGDIRTILLMALAGIPMRAGFADTGGGFLLHQLLWEKRGEHQVEKHSRLLSALGVDVKETVLKLNLTAQPEIIKNLLPNVTDEVKTIVMHIGAGYPSKCWPAVRFYELLLKLITYANCRVVLIGQAPEKAIIDQWALDSPAIISLAGKTKFRELVEVLRKADLFIGNDSGPAHLAAALGIPEVIVYGGTNDIREWAPFSAKATIINHPVDCSPCEAKVCPLGHHDCVNEISVDRVWEAIQRELQTG